MNIEAIGKLAAALTAVVGTILGVLQYIRSRRDKLAAVRQSFEAVVKSLASTVEVERISGAILLRRFYDPKSDVGFGGRKFWKDALNVSAAILRSQATGNFQKLLADGLAFAPNLEGADLQKTNLQFAYLGARDGVRTNLKRADFYRADLTRASLKNADAEDAVFYQARLHGTVFTDANLRNANFFEADLSGARFKGADLTGAKFDGARNVPPDIAHLVPPSAQTEVRVFVSKPGSMEYGQEERVRALLARLDAEGIRPLVLERMDYPQSGALAEVQRLMSGCAGAVIFGFKQLEVHKGTWRPRTSEEKAVESIYFSTPWNEIEAGMAVMRDLPLLVVSQKDVTGGIFDASMAEPRVRRLVVEDDWTSTNSSRLLADWYADVRERSRNTQSR